MTTKEYYEKFKKDKEAREYLESFHIIEQKQCKNCSKYKRKECRIKIECEQCVNYEVKNNIEVLNEFR